MKQNVHFRNILLDLLKFHTYSGNESIISEYIKTEMQRLGFKTNQDIHGNIYGVRGKADKYPLLNAHMDIVFNIAKNVEDAIEFDYLSAPSISNKQTSERLCRNCINLYDCVSYSIDSRDPNWNETYNKLVSDKYYAKCCQSYEYDSTRDYYNKYSFYGYTSYTENELKQIDTYLNEHYELTFNPSTGYITSNKLRVMGGDDKCGIAIALQVARELPKIPMKLLFTAGEESGCDGVYEFIKDNANWFNNVAYSLTIDRRDVDNLLMYSCGKPNCTPEFAAKIAAIGIKNRIMIKMEEGTLADVIYIRNYVENCVNMSAGYFNPHSTNEYISFNGMIRIKEWVKGILQEVDK